MSKPSETEANPEPSSFLDNRSLTFIGALGSILLFLFILWLAYLPNRAEDPLATTVAERVQILQEAESAWASQVDTLEVVDAEKGIYKVPLSRAMELTVQEYRNR